LKLKKTQMKEYLLLFRGGEAAAMQNTPELWQAHMTRWANWMRTLAQEQKFVSGRPLDYQGKSMVGTKKMVTDGPYAEGKEIVGGYIIALANTYEEALDIANGCPILEFDNGSVEIRELRDMAM
jgi:hypothetical protein